MTAIGVFIAVILAFFIIRLVYRQSGLNNLDVKLSFSATRATEGAQLVLTTVLTNEKWLPLPWVAVKLRVSRHLIFADMENAQISDNYYRNDLYNILMRQRITRRLSFTCSRRGYYSIPTVDLAAWDILMETKNAAMIECGAHLTVYPGTLPMNEVDDICVEIYGQLRARNVIHPDPFSFRGIREYSPHDPLKAVNFKASAKAQELMVNLWEYVNARQVILFFNLQRFSVWHNEVLDEYSIKLVASLGERLTRENVPLRFITNGHSVNANPVPELSPMDDEASLATRLQNEVKASPRPKNLYTEIPEGIGILQQERMLETLALLDVEQTEVTPLCDILQKTAEKYKTEPEYWIISTYHGPELEEVYRNLMEQGARTVWVLPYSVGLRTGEDDITLSPEVREKVILI
ncbi:MAG: DUF58 domain-containing protein [Defluviitaleaceae bacterium]|nr:DUF58 domain-containing protein [Defluviitaleaceae bacterium]